MTTKKDNKKTAKSRTNRKLRTSQRNRSTLSRTSLAEQKISFKKNIELTKANFSLGVLKALVKKELEDYDDMEVVYDD